MTLLLLAAANDSGDGLTLAQWALIWLGAAIAHAVIFLAAMISIVVNRRYTGGGKFLWILIVLAYPLLGALGWLIVGRTARILR